jgi:hypothetical protein
VALAIECARLDPLALDYLPPNIRVSNAAAASAVRNRDVITINILHCNDGTYALTVNGEVVAAGLPTNAAAWQEAERLLVSDTAEDANDDRFGGANGGGDRACRH